MVDIEPMREQIRRIREDTDADREVRESLQSIEESLSKMASVEDEPKPDRVKELRAEVDRLSDDAAGETADGLDRLAEQLRDLERRET